MAIDLRERVRDVPDWPEQGIVFRDITPLLRDPEALDQTIHALAEWGKERRPDVVLGAEARGFILGAAIAREIGCGFVPARRPGKLPPETIGATYVLATGGTVEAIAGLVESLGAEVVGVAFIIELTFLDGRERLQKYDFHSLITY